MIRAKIQQLVDRGVIRQSMSPWAAQCLCVKQKDGMLRLCIDWRELNKLLVSDSGGLGDMQTIFGGSKGKKYYFTQLDLASGSHQMKIAENDHYKTAFRDADGMRCEFTRAGFGLTVLPAAFTRRVKSALGHLLGVFSWPDDILIASDTWEEHFATLTLVLNRLLAAGLSVNFAKCIFGGASQEFLGMTVDNTGPSGGVRKPQTDARRGTARECRGVLRAVDHFRPYLAGRRFKLVTDCSALTWLFQSRELCPKLDRWALRLMEYDMELEWKAGVEHVVPDALSRLPVANPVEVDVDDSFPDYLSSAAAGASLEISGPELKGVRLAELDPVQVDQVGDADFHTSHPTPEVADFQLSALRALPFAASPDPYPFGAITTDRRRAAAPDKRTGGHPGKRGHGPTTVESSAPALSPPTLPPSPVRPGHDDIGEVLAARGEVPTYSSSQAIGGASAIDLTARVLTRPSELAHRQRDDTHLGQIRKAMELTLARGGVGATGIA
ncbi:unnamed protein product [Ectocarpus sp. CCAP 1310/34]|nr:unnamed protein product [Ectocarpus sp. CCAP 1310/34]